MADSQKQTPARQTFCGSLRREGHWKCLSLTLMIVGCLTAISWCHLPVSGKTSSRSQEVSYVSAESGGPCKDGYIYIPVACVVMLYLVYLVECWHSHTRLELRYKCDMASVYNYISRMQAALPVIWWKATCYHYVRRTRQVMRYRNGDAFTSTQVYYERVDSSTAGAAFNFTQCGVRDISRPLGDLDMYPAVRIRISKGFSFANVDTECQFEEQRARFFQEYDTKDDYMEGREGMDLMNVDFQEYMVAFRDPTHLPWYVSHLAFWLASVFLLSWPLRTITELKTAHLHYHVHKLFGSNYLEGDEYMGLMSRASTMNSAEFEISIRNNNVIVPSYSEAVLTDGLELMQQKHYGAIKTYPTKFPRSLTNVTLSARPASAGRRSATPTVMMNRVKKFKSCSAFGITECTDSSTTRGSVRQQIQQLLRDGGRLPRKPRPTSQFSMSSLSLVNGNVRFHIGTPASPEDSVISPSFSWHSVISSRIVEPRCEALEAVNEPSMDSVQRCVQQGELGGLSGQRPEGQHDNRNTTTQLDINQSLLANVINSSKSLLKSDVNGLENVEHVPPRRNNPVLREMSVNGNRCSDHVRSNRLPAPLPLNGPDSSAVVVATTINSPTTPSSPPHYEEAMTMRRLTSPTIRVDTEIQLTGHLQSTSTSEVPALRSSNDQHNSAPVVAVSFKVGIEAGDSFHVFCSAGSRTDIANTAATKTACEESLEGPHCRYSHPHQHHLNQHHRHHSQPLVLKTLPKVSSTVCTDSEDSDLECLHSAVPEPADREIRLSRNRYLQSSNLHPAPAGDGSMSGLSGPQAGHGAGHVHVSDRSRLAGTRGRDSSSGAGTGRVGRAATVSSPGGQGRRRETSV